eukprot:COSAG04_NODE_1170_length_7960_cov_2.783743_4_plen_164_part_00
MLEVNTADPLLEADFVTMIAWIRPLQYESSGSHGIIMNKEDSYEMGIEDGSGKFQDAFGNDDQRSCWRWFGNIRMPLHEWCKHFPCAHACTRKFALRSERGLLPGTGLMSLRNTTARTRSTGALSSCRPRCFCVVAVASLLRISWCERRINGKMEETEVRSFV